MNFMTLILNFTGSGVVTLTFKKKIRVYKWIATNPVKSGSAVRVYNDSQGGPQSASYTTYPRPSLLIFLYKVFGSIVPQRSGDNIMGVNTLPSSTIFKAYPNGFETKVLYFDSVFADAGSFSITIQYESIE